MTELWDRLRGQTDYARGLDAQFKAYSTDSSDHEATLRLARRSYDDARKSGYTVALALKSHVAATSAQYKFDGNMTGRFAIQKAQELYNTALDTPREQRNPTEWFKQFSSTMSGIKSYLEQDKLSVPSEAQQLDVLKEKIDLFSKNYRKYAPYFEHDAAPPGDLAELARHPEERLREVGAQSAGRGRGADQPRKRARAQELAIGPEGSPGLEHDGPPATRDARPGRAPPRRVRTPDRHGGQKRAAPLRPPGYRPLN